MSRFEEHWNRNFHEATPNKAYKVMNAGRNITTAQYDPLWGNRRGAWFDTKGKLLTDVIAWLDNEPDVRNIAPTA